MKNNSYVKYLLQNYNEIKWEINQLKLFLEENSWETSENEIIEELVFKRAHEEKVQSSQFSDTTSRIAQTYEQVMKQRSILEKRDIERLIIINQGEIRKLDSTISILQSSYKVIIQGIYMDRLSTRDLCTKLFISENTLYRSKRKAIEGIESLFSIYNKVESWLYL